MLENTLKVSFIITAMTYLMSLAFSPYPFQYLLKVLPIIILLVGSVTFLSGQARLWMSSGLIASGIGDIFLALPIEQSFIFGLSAFFIAQLIYTTRFFSCIKVHEVSSLPFILAIVLVIYSVMMAVYILPDTQELLIPVSAYLTVITLMGACALMSNLDIKVKVGALFFVTSDSVLALSIFKTPLPFSSYIVMLTYYLAQYFIIFGFIDSQRNQASRNAI